MTNELKISNSILSSNKLFSEKDLIFSYNQFLETEEYEKCSIINDLIINKKFDNNLASWSEAFFLIKKTQIMLFDVLKGCKETQLEMDSDFLKKQIYLSEKLIKKVNLQEEEILKRLQNYK